MITRLSRLRYLRIVGLAAGAVAVAGAAVLVTASASGLNLGFKPAASAQTLAAASPSTTQSKATDVCGAFMTHLGTDLGKSQADLNAAIQKAIGETLTDEVNNGTITQTQANAIKQQLGNQQVCALAGQLGKGGHHGAKGQLGAYLQQYQTAAASALGISETELKTDLGNGQTLSQIAAAKKVSEADFRTRLIAKLQPVLDTAVANKHLTTAQEQMIINRLKTGPLPLWDKPLHKGAPATASPAASA
jgi:hypothetical protein